MENKEQEFINKYIIFKEGCIHNNIINLDEVIKLFEVYLKLSELLAL